MFSAFEFVAGLAILGLAGAVWYAHQKHETLKQVVAELKAKLPSDTPPAAAK